MPHVRAYLQLMRFPAVFTAMADVLLGFLLTHDSLAIDGDSSSIVLLLIASSALYLAGMVFNDVFDRDVDAVERPSRPLPSGRVSLRNATVLGAVLIAVGIITAAVAGIGSALVALSLTAAIFLYNAILKKTPAGPLGMGLCRFLNVLLGASAGLEFSELWTGPQVAVAAVLAIYISGVTWFSRQESAESNRGRLLAAAVVINFGLCGLLFLALNHDVGIAGKVASLRVIYAWFVIVLVINRPICAALSQPSPLRVQHAVKTMIQWLIMLDATMIFAATANAQYALITAVLLAPAMFLGRWIYVT